MFGSSSNNTGGGFSFGASKPAAPAATTGFSFGAGSSTTQAAPTTGGLFGSAPAAPATTGGLFGSAPAAPATTGGFSFGGASSTTPAASTTTGGLFGAKPAATTTAPSTGGLFGGASTTSTAPATTGGLFGGATTAPATGGGLFGAKPATTGGFSFGNTSGTTATAATPAQTLTQQQTTQPQTISSTQPSFAWSTNNSSTASQQKQPLSYLSNSNSNNSAPSASTIAYSLQMLDQLSKVKNSWDPTSQTSQLTTYFYNVVDESVASNYVKPLNENTEAWEKANEAKPRSNVIPVKATGFEDLQRRSQAQINHVGQARLVLQQINEKYTQITEKHELDTQSRIQTAKVKNVQIQRRILNLVTSMAVLKSKGYQLSPSEEALIDTFQTLLNKSQDPSGLGKSDELWARLGILKDKAKLLTEQLDSAFLSGESDKTGEDPEEETEESKQQALQVAKVLEQQFNGLKYLGEIVQDSKDFLNKKGYK